MTSVAPAPAAINYNSAAELGAFLEARGLAMRKKHGQNFLINPAVRAALAAALGAEAGDAVWEIGPGLGAMTRILLDRGLRVCAFEIDAGFSRALRELFAGERNFSLVEGDVLKTLHTSAQPPAPFLLGNLPYNIAAALLADSIERGRLFKRMVVTVQREVARRMAARPGTPEYSSFSVLCASVYTVRPLMVIQGASFYPRPAVESQGALLELRSDIDGLSWPPLLYPLVRALFASRRKMIKNNLAAFLASRMASLVPGRAAPGELAAGVLSASGIDGTARAETLSLEDFAALAETIEDMRV
jgi:16S rRNA (adenine1518-N6/adenine1519-N6)-dimethyltransferase